ncbi:cytidine deaminase [Algicella marina]|uniref:Cytidine deaminase n=1 Tax=Algicella marina TaxID=2683284 RepID=A0A6P1SYD7_9RHOB|nr:cytidine deaminase [Algicella marina]QHQ34009.1 cytidine deaminase [Algicella marina]
MNLFDAALAARENAYAPYSKFKVGAAVRTADGNIYSGCNVENAAYPEGTCAEAGALAAMAVAGGRKVVEVLVIADTEDPIPPCGGCRQKLAEFAAGDVKVTLAGLQGPKAVTTVAALLPGAFSQSHMEGSDV